MTTEGLFINVASILLAEDSVEKIDNKPTINTNEEKNYWDKDFHFEVNNSRIPEIKGRIIPLLGNIKKFKNNNDLTIERSKGNTTVTIFLSVNPIKTYIKGNNKAYFICLLNSGGLEYVYDYSKSGYPFCFENSSNPIYEMFNIGKYNKHFRMLLKQVKDDLKSNRYDNFELI